MAISNPSFEDAGALPGDAAGWTLTAVTSAEIIAGFDSAPQQPAETFERWSTLLDSLDDVTVARALFNSAAQAYDDFESAWSNDGFLFELTPGALEACSFGGDVVERYEHAWQNDSYVFNWFQVTAVLAPFAGGVEAFEQRWLSNERFSRNWSDVTSATAQFDASAHATESFEGTWARSKTI